MSPLQEKELRVIGACLHDVGACAVAIDLLRPEMFSDGKHQKIFSKILKLFVEDSPVNLVTVSDALPGMASVLSEAFTSVPDTTNVEYYARIIQQEHLRRTATRLGTQMTQSLKNGDDVFETIDSHMRELSDSSVFGRVDTHIRYGIDDALGRLAKWEAGLRTDVVPTGFYSLDQIIGGFPVGELTTLAAQTGAGKTSMMSHFNLAYARRVVNGKDMPPALIFSCEMSREQLIHLMAANESHVDLSSLKSTRAQSDLVKDYKAALASLSQFPIHVDDEPSPSLEHIMAVSRRIQATGGLGMISVDYDERIEAPGDSEELRVSAIAKGLKRIAKLLEVPVVSLSQYSRKATQPAWPDDSWLRYSGKKEQESALILHWYWPHFWTRKGYAPENIPDYKDEKHGYLICTKNRFGRTGHVNLQFVASEARFRDPNEPVDPKDIKLVRANECEQTQQELYNPL